jgi:hypothetical protein
MMELNNNGAALVTILRRSWCRHVTLVGYTLDDGSAATSEMHLCE